MVTDTQTILSRLQSGTDIETALDFFDGLPAVDIPDILGNWRGSELPTGNPLDGLLETYGWHGKRFEDADSVHPLVFRRPNGSQFCVNPARLPMSLIVKHADRLGNETLAALARRLSFLLTTRRPRARLRMTQYRGVLSATMIYDALPINDVFRRVSPDTLVGAMDMRGLDAPFLFVLTRET